jgi:hypothetical protein
VLLLLVVVPLRRALTRARHHRTVTKLRGRGQSYTRTHGTTGSIPTEIELPIAIKF